MTTAQSGGAIFNRGSLVVSNSIFRNNMAGVLMHFCCVFFRFHFTIPSFLSVFFLATSTAGSGGAIYSSAAGLPGTSVVQMQFSSVSFQANMAGISGGALEIGVTTMQATDSRWDSNTAVTQE